MERFAGMNAAEIRLEMARLGWDSDDRVDHMGWGLSEDKQPQYGYVIWFTRWNWHGRRIDKVSFHSSVAPGPSGVPDTIDMLRAVLTAATRACAAWEQFTEPGMAPRQGRHGEQVEGHAVAMQQCWNEAHSVGVAWGITRTEVPDLRPIASWETSRAKAGLPKEEHEAAEAAEKTEGA